MDQHLTCLKSFINGNYNCRYKLGKNTYLMKNLFRNQLCRYNVPPNHRSACSFIYQQRFHPRAGHDSSRKKGQCRLTHSQGFPINQTTQQGFTRSSRSKDRLNSKLVASSPVFSCIPHL